MATECRIFRRALSSVIVGKTDAGTFKGSYRVGMTNMQKCGRRIRELRDAAQLKQVELADIIGVSRSAIAGIETGGDSAGLKTAIALADYFKVPLDWLLCRTTPAGGPNVGHFVDDADELAWLELWRSMSVTERAGLLGLLRSRGSRTAE